MSINAAIEKAIQDNLPAATAGELNKYLTKAQANEKELEMAKESLKVALKTNDKLNNELADLKSREKNW